MTRCTCMAQAPWTRWIATGVARPCRLSALSPSNLSTSMTLFLSCTRSELDSPPCWWVSYGWCNRINLFSKPFLRQRCLFQTGNQPTCKRCTTSTRWNLIETCDCLCGYFSSSKTMLVFWKGCAMHSTWTTLNWRVRVKYLLKGHFLNVSQLLLSVVVPLSGGFKLTVSFSPSFVRE